jgi:hypothetical protein
MSRTFRRKNWEKTVKVNGSKINGFYTTWDTLVEYPCKNGHGGCPAYRAMTKEEINDKYWGIHGESKHHNAWGPSKLYREYENRDLKSFNKREMVKWEKLGDEYEPMVISMFKKSAFWAWR